MSSPTESPQVRVRSGGSPQNPFIYALDSVLPIIDLGEQKAWIPQGAALTAEWLLTCAGWILTTTAVVAGVTNALNRRD